MERLKRKKGIMALSLLVLHVSSGSGREETSDSYRYKSPGDIPGWIHHVDSVGDHYRDDKADQAMKTYILQHVLVHERPFTREELNFFEKRI
jgi:hypothetical protein